MADPLTAIGLGISGIGSLFSGRSAKRKLKNLPTYEQFESPYSKQLRESLFKTITGNLKKPISDEDIALSRKLQQEQTMDLERQQQRLSGELKRSLAQRGLSQSGLYTPGLAQMQRSLSEQLRRGGLERESALLQRRESARQRALSNALSFLGGEQQRQSAAFTAAYNKAGAIAQLDMDTASGMADIFGTFLTEMLQPTTKKPYPNELFGQPGPTIKE